MTLYNTENCIFLIIDIQEKLLNSVFNKEEVLKNSQILSKASKILKVSTIVTEQYPKGLGETIFEIKNNLEENTVIIEKTNFSALREEKVKDALSKLNKKQVVLFGIETHICVYQTAIELLDAGYEVTIVKNACGSRQESEFLTSLENLKQKGISIKTCEMILFELLKSSKHPNFKEIQNLIK